MTNTVIHQQQSVRAAAAIRWMLAVSEKEEGNWAPHPHRKTFMGPRTSVTVEYYCSRLARYANCQDGVLDIMTAFLHRCWRSTRASQQSLFLPETIHRLIIGAFVIAIKSTMDIFESMQFYARLGGISAAQMSSIELALLDILDYDVHVSEDEYRSIRELTESLAENTKSSTKGEEENNNSANWSPETHPSLMPRKRSNFSYSMLLDDYDDTEEINTGRSDVASSYSPEGSSLDQSPSALTLAHPR